MIEKKSELTKRKIMDTSKHLFYERGLNKTSMRQIATECGINQSLVYYYFDSKEGLAAEIMAEFSEKVKSVMHICLDYEQDPLLFMLAFVRMLIKEVSKDERELQFYCELFYVAPSDRPFVHEIHQAVEKHLQKKIPFQEVQIAHILSDSAWGGLIKALENGEIDVTLKDILNIIDRQRFLYLKVNNEVLEQKIQEAEDIVKRIPVHEFKIID